MNISFKKVIATSIALIAIYETIGNYSSNGDDEKYLNPLIINKGLIQSIRMNNEQNIDKYLGYNKIKINIETAKGNTPLVEAIMSKKISKPYLHKIMVASDINHINKHSFRPIHMAITVKDIDKVMMITNMEDFKSEVVYNGKNIIEFSVSLKDGETNLKDRLALNYIITFLKQKYPTLLKK